MKFVEAADKKVADETIEKACVVAEQDAETVVQALAGFDCDEGQVSGHGKKHCAMGDRPRIFSAATGYAMIGQRPQLPILALHRILFMRAWPGASSGIKCNIHFAKSLFTLNNRKIFIRTLI